ncbi:hypothetical protein SAMN04487944_1318 [Gracilibacillus ureilyticus]|uniref:Uncharacterized protein n=1 Tax=Gracilibacillus ureilyticus TaxID=531814 RepID=A0A1H9W037_9BACI|nr:hypothetical protein SAMN04487944_1318 [Gracilibacillus ureilyticus]
MQPAVLNLSSITGFFLYDQEVQSFSLDFAYVLQTILGHNYSNNHPFFCGTYYISATNEKYLYLCHRSIENADNEWLHSPNFHSKKAETVALINLIVSLSTFISFKGDR